MPRFKVRTRVDQTWECEAPDVESALAWALAATARVRRWTDSQIIGIAQIEDNQPEVILRAENGPPAPGPRETAAERTLRWLDEQAATPFAPPLPRRGGWPKGKPRGKPGPGRPKGSKNKRPSVAERARQEAAAEQPAPAPPLPSAWFTTGQPTLLEAWLMRHPDAPAEMRAGLDWRMPDQPTTPRVEPLPEPPPEPTRGRPRKGHEGERRERGVCECGNPYVRGDRFFRCQRCRDMESAASHYGESEQMGHGTGGLRKAYDPATRANGYVDSSHYRASPAEWPNLGPEHTDNPGLAQWLRRKGRLRASDIRQWPSLMSISPFTRHRE